MLRVKQEIIDEYCEGHTTGLRQRDNDDEDFPSEVIIRESSDSNDDDDHDPDQIEMQQIYEQQERKRNRRHISESSDSQFKTEPDDIRTLEVRLHITPAQRQWSH